VAAQPSVLRGSWIRDLGLRFGSVAAASRLSAWEYCERDVDEAGRQACGWTCISVLGQTTRRPDRHDGCIAIADDLADVAGLRRLALVS
jgi:hypothetical protein